MQLCAATKIRLPNRRFPIMMMDMPCLRAIRLVFSRPPASQVCALRTAVLALTLPLVVVAQVSLAETALAQTGPDKATIRSVISGQIAAFLSGDNEQAYSFAAPAIKGTFRSVDQFVGMVKRQYLPVYAPRNYAFGEIRALQSDVVQQVFVTGPKGKNWIALYTLQQQPDGAWKISGCYIRPDDGRGA